MKQHQEKIINGAKIADGVTQEVAKQVATLRKQQIIPGLAAVLVGNNPASRLYVNRKKETAQKVGMLSRVIELKETIATQNLIDEIQSLNNDPHINGILVQLPLPKHIDTNVVINTINPAKDVDGLTITNVGRLITKDPQALIPCTPQGCMILIHSIYKDVAGKHAAVIGRSNIVGRPMAHLLLNNDCTVTTIHSKTRNPAKLASQADILVVAAGYKHLVTKEWVKQDAIVIDVGINRYENTNGKIQLTGDVDFEDVISKVKAITPVPRGVGPMTIACLLKNTVRATCLQKNMALDF